MVQTKWLPDFVKELPSDLSGKVFVITGTTTGTGRVAAQVVAQLGGEVILLNRNSTRVTDMLQALKDQVPNGKFVSIDCDLQDFSSVRKAAKQIQSQYQRIYCLANNAGISGTPDEATVDGYDLQMQTNHLSHFLLTAELYPLLVAEADATGDARIVSHTSVGRKWVANKCLERKYLERNGGNLGGNDFEILGGGGPSYHRYFQSKLANSVFSNALHAKLQAKHSKVRSIAAHPGGAATSMAHKVKIGRFLEFLLTQVAIPLFMQSAEDGAMGLLKAMTHPDAESGTLYGPKTTTGLPVEIPAESFEVDPEAFQMLWETSEQATGIVFNP